MAIKADALRGGYPHFDDPGGPTGKSDLPSGRDVVAIENILGEITHPIPKEVEGQLLNHGDGTIAFCNRAGLTATRACLMHIDAAQSRIDSGVEPKEVAISIREAASKAMSANDPVGKNSACIRHCRLAFTKSCELATGVISSSNGTNSRPITEDEVLSLVGVEIKKSRRRAKPEGRTVFKIFYNAAINSSNGFVPRLLDPHSPDIVMAEAYILEWLEQRRPQGRKKAIKPLDPAPPQLKLFE